MRPSALVVTLQTKPESITLVEVLVVVKSHWERWKQLPTGWSGCSANTLHGSSTTEVSGCGHGRASIVSPHFPLSPSPKTWTHNLKTTTPFLNLEIAFLEQTPPYTMTRTLQTLFAKL